MADSRFGSHRDRCYWCGYGRETEKHHVFGHSNRKWSEQDGLFVYLCAKHHRDPRIGVHFNPDMMNELHKEGQRLFEEQIGNRKEFMDRYGKNYLDDEVEW